MSTARIDLLLASYDTINDNPSPSLGEENFVDAVEELVDEVYHHLRDLRQMFSERRTDEWDACFDCNEACEESWDLLEELINRDGSVYTALGFIVSHKRHRFYFRDIAPCLQRLSDCDLCSGSPEFLSWCQEVFEALRQFEMWASGTHAASVMLHN